MDKIWYRNPEVIGRCGGDEKTRMTTQNRQKSNAKKKETTTTDESYTSNFRFQLLNYNNTQLFTTCFYRCG